MKNSLEEYSEYPVPESLRNVLVCYWIQKITGDQSYEHRVLPDACSDLIFFNDKDPILTGAYDVPNFVALPPGAIIFGIRFQPGSASQFIRESANRFVNQDLLAKNMLSKDWDRISELFSGSNSESEKRARLEALLPHLLKKSNPNAFIKFSTRWLASYPNGDIQSLSRATGFSPRKIHRLFLEYVGYRPKTFQKILRFQRSLHLYKKSPKNGLAGISIESGYSDQAHMTRNFKEFTNQTPKELLGSRESTLILSDLFKI